MKRLDDYSFGERVIATFIIVLVVILILALIGFLSGRWESADAAAIDEPPLHPKYEEQILALDREALDHAYEDHIKLVFGIWMKGPNDPESPRRAGVGARNAREGYVKSMEAIERRERRLKEQQR